jgi:hypothetical protein
MARKKKKTPSWIDVKRNIKDFNKDQLLELIGDLYRLSANNKEFFHARFSLSEDPLESYKRIIQDAMHPYLEDNETLDIGRAEDAIERYSKAIDDVKGETELKVFKERLNEIMDSASGIGWGYHDALRELYYESFPDDH